MDVVAAATTTTAVVAAVVIISMTSIREHPPVRQKPGENDLKNSGVAEQ